MQRAGKAVNILIRADNGPSIGLGHFIRCTSLANEFAEQGHSVFLATSKGSTINDLARKTYKKIIYIENEWDINCEEPITKEFTAENPIDVLIVDTYEANQNYYQAISKYSKALVAFDDINNPNLYFDILINGNIYAEKINYIKKSEKCLLLLGPKYLVLRPQYSKAKPRHIQKEVKKVLITFGGSDPLNFTHVILKTIKENISDYKDLEFNVIIGPGFRNLNQIEEISSKLRNVNLIINPGNIIEIIQRTDVAISAAGSTTYELACMGIPSIIFVVANNQELLAEEMGNMGFVISKGHISSFNVRSFLSSLNELINNYSIRKKMHEKATSTFDARGAERCANEIIRFLK